MVAEQNQTNHFFKKKGWLHLGIWANLSSCEDRTSPAQCVLHQTSASGHPQLCDAMTCFGQGACHGICMLKSQWWLFSGDINCWEWSIIDLSTDSETPSRLRQIRDINIDMDCIHLMYLETSSHLIYLSCTAPYSYSIQMSPHCGSMSRAWTHSLKIECQMLQIKNAFLTLHPLQRPWLDWLERSHRCSSATCGPCECS